MLTLSNDRNGSEHNRRMVELSADLLPSILQFCDDKTLLNTTSVVCRGWFDVSRYLFVKDRLVILFDGTTDAFDRLRNLVHHATTFKWNHVNHITFKLDGRFRRDSTYVIWNTLDPDQFIRILMPLVEMTGESLRSLSIHFVMDLPNKALHFTTPLLSLYPKITHLELRCICERWSLANIIQTVRPLQHLKILSISNVDIDVDPGTLPANLQKLFIRDCCDGEEHSHHVLGVLSRPSRRGPQHFLTQAINFHKTAKNISHLTRCLNLTIESMRFRHIFTQLAQWCFSFDFSQFTELKSLTFDVTDPRAPSSGRGKGHTANFNAGLYSSLRTIKPLHLEEIVLVVPPDAFEYPEVWAAIDRLLSLARFPRIQDVTFLVYADNYSGETHESLESLVAQSFSLCLAAGRNVNVKIGKKDILEAFKQDVLHHLPPTACSIIVDTRNNTPSTF